MNKESKIFKNIITVLLALLILGLATDTASATQAPVNLGTAGNFVILSKSGITNVPTSAITGNIGTSPITGASITGLGCSEVNGTIYTVDAAGPACRLVDPVLLTAAVSDMQTAYTDAAGRTSPDHTELGAGNIGGMTLTPGLYKWGTGVKIPPGGVTLSGGANDVWIFQIAQDLTVDNGAKVTLSGGAQARNIFWQVAGKTTLGTTSDFKGIILSKTLISLNTGATLNGRALAQTAVTLNANVITAPSSSVSPTNTPTVTSKPTGVVTGTPAMPTGTATPAMPTGTGTPAKPTVISTPAPAPTNKVPGFELVLVAVALCSGYLFGRKRR